MYIIYIYEYKGLACVIMQTERLHDLQLASWRPRKPYVIVTVYVQWLENQKIQQVPVQNMAYLRPKNI